MAARGFKDGLRQEDNGTWTVKVGTQMKRGFETKAEAREFRNDLRVARKSGRGTTTTVAQWYERWMRDFVSKKAATTQLYYKERLKRFVEQEGSRRLTDITREEALNWAVDRPADVKGISPMFSDAVKFGIDGLTSNPFKALGMKKSKGRGGPTRERLTREDIGRLREAALEVHGAFGPVVASLIDVAAWTGMRPAELYAFQADDADMEHDLIHVRRSFRSKTNELVDFTKNGETRRIALLPPAKEAIRAMQARRPSPDIPFLFYGVRGQPLSQITKDRIWNPVRVAFGDPKLDFYELRHFFGSMLAEAGLSPYDIAVQMGHQDGGRLAMKTYIHTPELDSAERTRRAIIAAAG